MPWAAARMAQLLSCQKSMAVLTLGSAEAQSEGASTGPQEVDVDELVMVRESVHLGLFQTEIIEGWVKPLLRDTAHVMITLLRAEGQLQEARPLPPGLHVLHAYMHLKNGSSKVSLMVRNISNSHIFLKKGVPVARVMLGCTSAIKHEIHIENSEPFKEWFWHIPLPLLEEVCASLRDMLEAGAICPS